MLGRRAFSGGLLATASCGGALMRIATAIGVGNIACSSSAVSLPALPSGAYFGFEAPQGQVAPNVADGTWHTNKVVNLAVAGEDLTQSNDNFRPLLVQIGTKYVLRFGANFRINLAALAGGSRPAAHMVLLVARCLALDGTARVLCGDGAAANATHRIATTAAGAWGIRQGGTTRSGGTADLLWHTFVADFNTTDTLYVDGVQVASGDSGSTLADGFALGHSSAGQEMDWFAAWAYPTGTPRTNMDAHYAADVAYLNSFLV